MARADPKSIPTERLAWTAGVIVSASLLHWPRLPAWIPALLLACIAWRFAGKLRGAPMPPRWLLIVLALGAFLGVLGSYQTINGVSAGSALLVVMVALKFFECHTQRDQLVLMIIAYFLVFAGLLYGGGILTGAFLVGFVLITTVGLLQLGRGGALLPGWPTAKYAARLLLQATPIMIALFILFPRLPGPLWGIPGSTSSGATGLSGEMSPGDITDLGLSDEIAFRVEFMGTPPAASDLYWRGPVLSNFDGRTWTIDRGMRRRAIDTLEFIGGQSVYHVSLEPTDQPWLFALDMPRSWTSETRRRTIAMGSDYQLRSFTGGGLAPVFEYEVTSYTDYAAREPLTEANRKALTRLPDGRNPRSRALAESWLRDSPTPRSVIDHAMDFLRGEEFFYTLTPPPLGLHSADEFLFETREGFCEHYASAFTILMRAAGIPARVVTGYQGGELNPIGDYYVVRQADAHAWVEVWLEDDGWVRVDPIAAVAPERIAFGSLSSAMDRRTATSGFRRSGLVRQFLMALDTVDTFWNRYVVGYGFRLQRGLLERLGVDRPSLADLLSATILATLALMILLSVYLTMRFRRERHRDPAAKCFGRFTQRLRTRNVPPLGPGETPAQYAARAMTALPESAAQIREIVSTYLAARYEPDDQLAALSRLRLLVDRFRPGRARA